MTLTASEILDRVGTTIPDFPYFADIGLEHKELFDQIFEMYPPEISDMTFTNFFAWQPAYHFMVAKYHENIIVRGIFHNLLSYLEPLIPIESPDIFRDILEHHYLKNEDARFVRVCEQCTSIARSDLKLVVTEDRDNFDYVYDRQVLADLKGRRFDGKRNFIKRAAKAGAVTAPITPDLIEGCRKLLRTWREEKSKMWMMNFERADYEATQRILSYYDILNVFGMAVLLDGEVQAFTIAERLNENSCVTHVEKASRAATGLYQFVNNSFASEYLNDFQYVNREQDLGIPSLRKAKNSYYPERLIPKYTIELKAAVESENL